MPQIHGFQLVKCENLSLTEYIWLLQHFLTNDKSINPENNAQMTQS